MKSSASRRPCAKGEDRRLRRWLARALVPLLAAALVPFAWSAPAEAAASGGLKLKPNKTAFKQIGSKRTTAIADAVVTVPATLPASVGFQFRSKGKSNGYRAVYKIAADGSVTGTFHRVASSRSTPLGSPVKLGFRVSPGDRLHLQATATAIKNVKLYLRAWKVGTAKPKKWALVQSDSSSKRLTKAGPVYLWAKGPSAASLKYESVRVRAFTAKKAAAIGVAKPAKSSGSAVLSPSRPPVATPPAAAAPKASYGVPAGIKLTKISGDLTITKAGTVVDGVEVDGYVRVDADNVTIKNSVVRGPKDVPGSRALVMSWSGAKNLKVMDTTLIGRKVIHVDGVSGSDMTLERLDISGTVDAVKVIRGKAIIRDSWFHDSYYQATGAGSSDGQTHNDGIQVEGGANTVITGNRIEGFHNAAIMVTQNVALIDGLRIEGNQLSGGACSINMAEGGKGPLRGVKILSNKFSGPFTKPDFECPMIWPSTTKPELKGNTWLGSSTEAVPRKGGVA